MMRPELKCPPSKFRPVVAHYAAGKPTSDSKSIELLNDSEGGQRRVPLSPARLKAQQEFSILHSNSAFGKEVRTTDVTLIRRAQTAARATSCR